MENNKKANTLYAVLGIATLLVAIVGATFAYFSASQTNSDIQGTTAKSGGLSLVVNSVTGGTNNNIVPLNLITNQQLKSGSEDEYVDATDQFDDAIAGKCVDSLNNNICTVYKVTVSNVGDNAVQVLGTLNLTSNATNMYWKVIEATTTPATEGEDATPETLATGTAIEGFGPVAQGTEGFITSTNGTTGTNLSLAGSASHDYFVIVWLEEMGTAQEDADASTVETPKTYTGNITFDAVDAAGNKSGVTATFTH